MKRMTAIAAAAILAIMASPVSADAFDDARQSLIAGDIDSVLLGLTMGAFVVNAQDAAGYTLLHYAAKTGSQVAVDALLERGADPTIKAKDGTTAAMLATVPALRTQLSAASSPKGP